MESKKRKAFETLDRDDAKARDNNNNDNHVHTVTIEQEDNYGRTPLTSLKWDQSLDIPTSVETFSLITSLNENIQPPSTKSPTQPNNSLQNPDHT